MSKHVNYNYILLLILISNFKINYLLISFDNMTINYKFDDSILSECYLYNYIYDPMNALLVISVDFIYQVIIQYREANVKTYNTTCKK